LKQEKPIIGVLVEIVRANHFVMAHMQVQTFHHCHIKQMSQRQSIFVVVRKRLDSQCVTVVTQSYK
jgi:hypothetical protein